MTDVDVTSMKTCSIWRRPSYGCSFPSTTAGVLKLGSSELQGSMKDSEAAGEKATVTDDSISLSPGAPPSFFFRPLELCPQKKKLKVQAEEPPQC